MWVEVFTKWCHCQTHLKHWVGSFHVIHRPKRNCLHNALTAVQHTKQWPGFCRINLLGVEAPSSNFFVICSLVLCFHDAFRIRLLLFPDGEKIINLVFCVPEVRLGNLKVILSSWSSSSLSSYAFHYRLQHAEGFYTMIYSWILSFTHAFLSIELFSVKMSVFSLIRVSR